MRSTDLRFLHEARQPHTHAYFSCLPTLRFHPRFRSFLWSLSQLESQWTNHTNSLFSLGKTCNLFRNIAANDLNSGVARFTTDESNLFCSKSGCYKLHDFWPGKFTRESRGHTRELRHVLQNKFAMGWYNAQHVYSYFEKGWWKKCTRQFRKVLWVALSSQFFNEI